MRLLERRVDGPRVWDACEVNIERLYTPMEDGVHAVKVLECLIGNGGYGCWYSQVISFRCKIAGMDGEWSVRFHGCSSEPRQFYLTPEDAKDGNGNKAILSWCETFSGHCKISKYDDVYKAFPSYLKCYHYPTAYNCYLWNGCKAVSGLAYNYEWEGCEKLRCFAYDLLHHCWPEPMVKAYPTAEACEADNACKVIEFDDDESFAEQKRDEFRDYVAHHCPGFEDRIDWEYFMNLKSMPENLAMQVENWTRV